MAPKRKATALEEPVVTVSKRKTNGIKGITVESKSNDPLRDKLLETLRKSGIAGKVESRIVFAHTGIYVNDCLFGWVGKGTSFSIRCNNAAQRNVCVQAGCEVMKSEGHKEGNYYLIPETIQASAVKLRKLAEDVIAAAPPPKLKTAKARK